MFVKVKLWLVLVTTASDFAQYFSNALDKEIATKKMKSTKDKYLELKNMRS